MIAGAREVGVSPSIVRSFPRKEAALVEFFMDDCLQKLIDRIDSGVELSNLIPSERISKLVKIHLEMQAPYISKWPQALSIQVSFHELCRELHEYRSRCAVVEQCESNAEEGSICFVESDGLKRGLQSTESSDYPMDEIISGENSREIDEVAAREWEHAVLQNTMDKELNELNKRLEQKEVLHLGFGSCILFPSTFGVQSEVTSFISL